MQAATTEPSAELEGVVRRHGATVALDRVDLTVRAGEVLALLGANGAGKSTAIGCWLGLLEPHAGHARLFGRSPRLREVRRMTGVMLQEAQLPSTLQVRELLAHACAAKLVMAMNRAVPPARALAARAWIGDRTVHGL